MSVFFGRGDPDDPWLNLKIGIFTIGALLALLGVGLDNDWLVGAAVAVLAGGFLLRFLPAPGSEADADRDLHGGAGGGGGDMDSRRQPDGDAGP